MFNALAFNCDYKDAIGEIKGQEKTLRRVTNAELNSLVRCRGGFIFVDFTLACCQPIILTNRFLKINCCPYPCPWTPTHPSSSFIGYCDFNAT